MAKLEPALPYVIENNRYAMGTSIERASSQTDLSGSAGGIPGADGMDVEAVHAAGEKAVAHIRAGKGPYILEMLTYRYRGHSMWISQIQKARRSRQSARRTDPIKLWKRAAGTGILDEAEAKKQRDIIKEDIEVAVDFALDAALPPGELMVDILADSSLIEEAKMAVKILMPALSPTMESGKIAQWLVAENDTVARAIFSPRLKPIKRLSNWSH